MTFLCIYGNVWLVDPNHLLKTFQIKEAISMTPEKYKQLSIKEFTQAAKIYDSGHAGIYEIHCTSSDNLRSQAPGLPPVVLLCSQKKNKMPPS